MWSLIVLLCRKLRTNAPKKFVLSVVVVLYLLHPGITFTSFGLFNCRELDEGEFYLVKDLQVRCWKSQHYKYAFGLGVPMLLFWVVGIPVLGFLVLYQNKHKLDNPAVLMRFRVLYQGLKHEVYYWEFVNVGRKTALIVINVFVSQVNAQLNVRLSRSLTAAGARSHHHPRDRAPPPRLPVAVQAEGVQRDGVQRDPLLDGDALRRHLVR